MNTRGAILQGMLICALISCASHVAPAADINGTWISDVAMCQKVFERKGGRVLFAKTADIYGSGFIIEGNQIRGRMATCAVKARKEQGDVVNIIATCSTDIAIDTAHFSLKVIGPNRIVREFHGMPEMSMPYERCQF
jgi:hypothetical protein